MTGNSLHAFGNICQANPHTPGHQQGASREPHSPSSEELKHSGVRREAISPLSKTARQEPSAMETSGMETVSKI